jgi:RND family efflux transporter MFP subunit
MTRQQLSCRLLLVPAAAVLMACGGADSHDRTTMPIRPVTVYELAARDFARDSTLTGVVSLYRQERISFEVSGRVLGVLNPGIEVRGPAYGETGELVRQGDRIARVEATRYRSAVDGLTARLDAARRDLDAAKARATLARQTLERQVRVLEEGAGAQQAVDDSQAAFDQASAQLLASEATVSQIQRQLDSAREDLEDTVLYAPFSGRITRVHTTLGAVVEAGTPIVTLTLMDPLQVQVEVSADDERDIETGDRAIIYPKDPSKLGERVAVNAIVFEKSAVADPELRTFRIDLIVRNQRSHVAQRNPELAGLPIINDYLPAAREFQSEEGPLYVPTDSILRSGGRTYVLRLPGVGFHSLAERSAVGKHIPEKVEVRLGNQYNTVIQWNMRSVIESGDLKEGDFLIRWPTPEHLEGVAVGRPQWLLRPGDLVPVQLSLTGTPTGLWVPTHAIILAESGPAVVVVEEGLARERAVSVHETFREWQRIEGDGIVEGSQVVVGGAQYVSDGQPVSTTRASGAIFD